MAQFAPEYPKTVELEENYPLNFDAEVEISLARARIGSLLMRDTPGLVAIVGPCAMNEQEDIIAEEGDMMRKLTAAHEGLYMVHRLPTWKPRSNPNDWHGMETTSPYEAYRTLARQANIGTGTAIEMAHMPHAERYSSLTVFDWFGGRNVGAGDMMDTIAENDISLPLGVKNGLDGTVDQALEHVERLNQLRGSDGAPITLIYRGGANAKDPASWEEYYRQVVAMTGSRVVVDVAHGTEMAHDPEGRFAKSVDGQLAALEHVVDLADKEGLVPAAVMIEGSDANSPTDPHIPFHLAVNGVVRLWRASMSRVERVRL